MLGAALLALVLLSQTSPLFVVPGLVLVLAGLALVIRSGSAEVEPAGTGTDKTDRVVDAGDELCAKDRRRSPLNVSLTLSSTSEAA